MLHKRAYVTHDGDKRVLPLPSPPFGARPCLLGTQNSMKSLKLGEVMDEPMSESAGVAGDDVAYSHEADAEEAERGGGSSWDTGSEGVTEERYVRVYVFFGRCFLVLSSDSAAVKPARATCTTLYMHTHASAFFMS